MVECLTHQCVLPLVLFTLCAGTAKAEKRTWTDNSGKFSITGELMDVKDGMVMLRKAGGKTVAVPLTRLSDADRRYLQSLGHLAAGPSARDDVGEFLSYPDAMVSPPPWNDANTPFDLAEFLQAPPPEKNAAPRYLEAFRHFYAMDRELFPDLSEEEQRRRALEIWERSKEGRRLELGWKATPREFDPIAADAWLAQYEPGMQILVAAQELPDCVFQTSRSFDSYAPHQQAASEVRDVIQWRVRRDLHVGDLQRPLADLNVLLRLTRDLRPRGASGTQFSTMFLEESACRNLTPAILTAPEVTVQDCNRLLAIMIEHERGAIDMLREGVCADYIVARQTLHDPAAPRRRL